MKPAPLLHSTISAGEFKNKKILLPDADAARPTRLRLRQAMLNMLVSRVELKGLTVLDACCGSGALGLEALSRGASHVTLLDTNIATARKNVESLGLTARAQTVQADASFYTPAAPFNLVLADPPYASKVAQALLNNRAALGKTGSWWVIETAAATQLDWSGFTDVKEKVYGISKIGIARQS